METRLTLPPDFLRQAEDLIARLDADLTLLCESQPAASAEQASQRRRIFERLFRHTHTLKGTAATFGDDVTAHVAHEIEEALHAMRRHTRALGQGAVPPDYAPLENALQEAVDAVAVHTSSGELSETQRSEVAQAATRAVERLQSCTQALNASAIEMEGSVAATTKAFDELAFDTAILPPEWRASPLEPRAIQHLNEAAHSGLNLFSLMLKFSLDSFEVEFQACESVLETHGEIITTRPLPTDDAIPAHAAPHLRFCILYAAASGSGELRRLVSAFAVEVTPVRAANERNEIESAGIDTAAEDIRVPLDELDELVYRIGELQDEMLALFAEDKEREVKEHLPPALFVETHRMKPDALRRRFLEMQERMLRLRMVTVESRLQQALRAGRVAARVRGKEVIWNVVGGDVLLDKALAERLSAPLIHLVRNAVDHGIEDAAERRQAGKDSRGTIILQATADGGRVRIIVCDDGRGIEPERVRQAAVRSGIITPERHLSVEDNLRLIFRPGFTTVAHEQARNRVSGRGVGLNAAERAVEEFGGKLHVRSAPGRGTIFEMRLPTTLALLRAWVVRSGAVRYCIPAEYVSDALTVDESDFKHRGDSDVRRLLWRDTTLPLVRLSSLLEGNARSDKDDAYGGATSTTRHILVVRGAIEERVALVVDEWEPQREILARGLGAHARLWHGVTAATELDDGSLALLLDVHELIAMGSEGANEG